MADYQCHPIWNMSPGMYGDIDPYTLPISMELKISLAEWAREFDQTLNMEDPARSGFASVEAEAAFRAQGVLLAERLRNELGSNFSVLYKT